MKEDFFDTVAKSVEVKNYRKILQVLLVLLNDERYNDMKMLICSVLTQKEIQEPMTEVLDGGTDNDNT